MRTEITPMTFGKPHGYNSDSTLKLECNGKYWEIIKVVARSYTSFSRWFNNHPQEKIPAESSGNCAFSTTNPPTGVQAWGYDWV
jgi:hypothetical protein